VSSFESSIAAIKAMRRGGRAARRRVKNAGSASAAASTEISPDGAAAQTSSGTLSEAAAARSSEGTVPLAEQRCAPRARPQLLLAGASARRLVRHGCRLCQRGGRLLLQGATSGLRERRVER
jgi:hypothetical protein